MRLVLALLVLTGCPFSQSDNCGDAYERNMTHVKNGLYRIDGDPIAGSKQLRLQRLGDNLMVMTDDGRSTLYRMR